MIFLFLLPSINDFKTLMHCIPTERFTISELCASEMSIDGFSGSKIAKGSVGSCFHCLKSICSLAKHFAISNPQNPPIPKYYEDQKRRSVDFEAVDFLDVPTGQP